MRGAIQSLSNAGAGPALKMTAAVSMPGMAKMMQQMQGRGGAMPPGIDLTGNLVEVSCEMTEISTAPLADDLFAVPADFHSVSMKELNATPAAVTPVPAASAPALIVPPPPTPTPGGAVLQVGGGVTAPLLITKVQPQYSEEARQTRVEGTVVLSVVVGADGVAHELTVLRSLRPDLDQKAIEAVSQWKFRPGQKDGQPVNVKATIEVNFRINPGLPQE